MEELERDGLLNDLETNKPNVSFEIHDQQRFFTCAQALYRTTIPPYTKTVERH
jgi:hypothetical protein